MARRTSGSGRSASTFQVEPSGTASDVSYDRLLSEPLASQSQEVPSEQGSPGCRMRSLVSERAWPEASTEKPASSGFSDKGKQSHSTGDGVTLPNMPASSPLGSRGKGDLVDTTDSGTGECPGSPSGLCPPTSDI